MVVLIIKDTPIAYLRDIRALVITDLHIGYEYELEDLGIRIPPKDGDFLSQIKEAKEKTKSKRLIILGDLKHKVPRSKKEEIIRVKKFLSELMRDFKEITICKGNHDDRLEYIVPESIKVVSSRGFRYKNYGFFHGHAWPISNLWNSKIWIVGHLQPIIEIYKDGKRSLERVIIDGVPRIRKGKLEKIVLLPAFNPFVGGFIINKSYEIENSILSKLIDINSSRVFLLDGTEVGKIKELMSR